MEIKRENVMVGQEYNFNQLTSEEVMMMMTIMSMMTIMITMTMMVMMIMMTMMLTLWRDT